MRKQIRVLEKRSFGVLREKKERQQENREWTNGFHVSSKMIGALLGRQTTPGGVFLAPLSTIRLIYMQRQQWVTGRHAVAECGGDRG